MTTRPITIGSHVWAVIEIAGVYGLYWVIVSKPPQGDSCEVYSSKCGIQRVQVERLFDKVSLAQECVERLNEASRHNTTRRCSNG